MVVPLGPPVEFGRIVVGVDGSDTAKRALVWAVGEAALRQADVEVVGVYLPYRAHGPFGAEYMDIASPDWRRRFHHAAQTAVDDAIATATPPASVTLQQHIESGHPAKILSERSRNADLVVIGSRGLGGFAGLLLGSVSRQLLHHSHCPVVVVRQ